MMPIRDDVPSNLGEETPTTASWSEVVEAMHVDEAWLLVGGGIVLGLLIRLWGGPLLRTHLLDKGPLRALFNWIQKLWKSLPSIGRGGGERAVAERESIENNRRETVSRVLDGDTIRMEGGETVRIIGVDAPESHACEKLIRDAQATGVQIGTILARGREATEWLRSAIEGHVVELELDPFNAPGHRDTHGRLLAHVWTVDPEGERSSLVAPMILQTGHGVLTSFRHKYESQMLRARAEAIVADRGLDLGVMDHTF